MSGKYPSGVKNLLQATLLLATAACVGWWYWRSANQSSADAWAAGTDSID
jgi:predicted negative regulator of RcsB-dependent stress response